MVLGCRADHGGAAHVDLLDRVLEGGAACHCGLEGVEVDHDEVDGGDPVGLHLGDMPGIAALAQDAAMDARVQRLDAPVQHLGAAGDLRHLGDPQARFAQHTGRIAGGDQFDPPGRKSLRQGEKTRLVRNRKQRAAEGAQVLAHSSSSQSGPGCRSRSPSGVP
jgi:hypothetical protein